MGPHLAGRYVFGQRRWVAITGHKPLVSPGSALPGRGTDG